MKNKNLSFLTFIASYIVAHEYNNRGYSHYINCDYLCALAMFMEKMCPNVCIDITDDTVNWVNSITTSRIIKEHRVFTCDPTFDYVNYADDDAVRFITETAITGHKGIITLYEELGISDLFDII